MFYARRYVFLIAAILALALAAAAPGAVSNKGTVLLAYEKTPFKIALMDEMARILKRKGVEATVIEHTKGRLDREDPSGYGAVFVSVSGVNSQVRPWVQEWLNRNEDHAPRILLHVTQTRNWKVEVPVDAVTSASASRDVGRLAAQYAEMVRERMGRDAGR